MSRIDPVHPIQSLEGRSAYIARHRPYQDIRCFFNRLRNGPIPTLAQNHAMIEKVEWKILDIKDKRRKEQERYNDAYKAMRLESEGTEESLRLGRQRLEDERKDVKAIRKEIRDAAESGIIDREIDHESWVEYWAALTAWEKRDKDHQAADLAFRKRSVAQQEALALKSEPQFAELDKRQHGLEAEQDEARKRVKEDLDWYEKSQAPGRVSKWRRRFAERDHAENWG